MTVAIPPLTFSLLLACGFIMIVKKLINGVAESLVQPLEISLNPPPDYD